MRHGSVYEDDIVMLREAIPEHNLSPGRIGRVAQVLRYDHFEVEFEKYENNQHIVVLKIPLKYDQVQVFRHETTLNDRGFWQLIEEAKAQSNGDPKREEPILVDMLTERSIADIYAFGWLYRKYAWFAYRDDLWAAAYVIAVGCGDDSFSDFRGWLIGRGEKVYYDALQDPESLLDVAELTCEDGFAYGDVFTGSIEFAYEFAYEKKTGEEMPFAPHNPTVPKRMGQIWDEETKKRMYPKLNAKFGIGECDNAPE